MQSPSYVAPITISSSTQSQVFLAFALAMALTAVGAFLGMAFAPVLLTSGVFILCTIVELALVFTARMWIERSPMNRVLFALFPLLSGLTASPLLLVAVGAYANGAAIILNAAIATAALAGAAAVVARTTRINLAGFQGIALLALLGIIAFSLVQLFVPSLRTGPMEMALSGITVVVMAVFTAIDVQRILRSSALGAPPLLLALSLYLDIFNMFIAILRFMLAVFGDRR